MPLPAGRHRPLQGTALRGGSNPTGHTSRLHARPGSSQGPSVSGPTLPRSGVSREDPRVLSCILCLGVLSHMPASAAGGWVGEQWAGLSPCHGSREGGSHSARPDAHRILVPQEAPAEPLRGEDGPPGEVKSLVTEQHGGKKEPPALGQEARPPVCPSCCSGGSLLSASGRPSLPAFQTTQASEAASSSPLLPPRPHPHLLFYCLQAGQCHAHPTQPWRKERTGERCQVNKIKRAGSGTEPDLLPSAARAGGPFLTCDDTDRRTHLQAPFASRSGPQPAGRQ